MTLLISWAGVDTHGPSSVYIATDSRISWGGGKYFDGSIKTFTTKIVPAIIGYCGDSPAALMAIYQCAEVIDRVGIKNINHELSLYEIKAVFQDVLGSGYSSYPKGHEYFAGLIEIIVAVKFQSKFHVGVFSLDRNGKFNFEEFDMPGQRSGLITSRGSGKIKFDENLQRYLSKIENRNTSRTVFHAFVDSIKNDPNPGVGGAPQVVGIYRKKNSLGLVIGLVFNDECYMMGQRVSRVTLEKGIEVERWFNENFELTNPHSKSRHKDAQIQPDQLRRDKQASP